MIIPRHRTSRHHQILGKARPLRVAIGRRTLPLDDELVGALAELHKRQMAESAAAGPTYRAGLTGLDWYRGGEYLVTDQLGMPVHPEL